MECTLALSGKHAETREKDENLQSENREQVVGSRKDSNDRNSVPRTKKF